MRVHRVPRPTGRPLAATPRIRAFGEAALMVDLGGGIDVAANARALAIAATVRDDADAGWGAPIPAYDSVLVPFDPDRLDPAEAETRLRACVANGAGRRSRGVGRGGFTASRSVMAVRMAPTSTLSPSRLGLCRRPGRGAARLGRVPRLRARLRTGLRLPRTVAGRADGATSGPAAASRAGRQRRHRRLADRHLSRVDTGRLASHRPDRRRPLGRAARPIRPFSRPATASASNPCSR